MTSQKQVNANRQNAQKGGVKTDEGKAISRYNAKTHGIWNKLISDYEQDLATPFIIELIDELAPSSAVEHFLVDRVISSYVRLHRLAKAEREFVMMKLAETGPEKSIARTLTEDGFIPELYHSTIDTLLSTFARYETTIENRLYRALKMLDKENGFVSQKGHNE